MGTILLMGAGLQTTVTGPTYDPDAQLFFNAESAAGVTLTTTQMNAVNQWVVDSKAAGIWNKMKAVYPMVGNTATSHKFNLKNPLDTNAAYRLVFNGGGTHSSNGYSPGGVNGYANTFLNPSTAYGVANSGHMSYYSRTDSNGANEREMGSLTGTVYSDLALRYSNTVHMRWGETSAPTTAASANSLGFYVGSRTTSNTSKIFKNGTQILISGNLAGGLPSVPFFIGCLNLSNSPSFYSAKQCAFASIGDGLTDLESQLFYQITEKYQVALGRNINALQSFYYNSAYNNETNAFLFSTQITDNNIQTATDTLVTDLKTAGVFTKMKAIYPMVGGTATTHKFNLVNAQDTDAAFRLVFSGGITHSNNGILGNGTNGWVNTFCIMSNNFTPYDVHFSANINSDAIGVFPQGHIGARNNLASNTYRLTADSSINEKSSMGSSNTGNSIVKTVTATTHKGFWCGSKRSQITHDLIDPTGTITSNTITTTTTLPANTIGLLVNRDGGLTGYSSFSYSFFSFGLGLTTTEMTALKLAETNFQTALGRI